VAIGDEALDANTTAANNTAVGIQALQQTLTAYNNTAVGTGALAQTTTGVTIQQLVQVHWTQTPAGYFNRAWVRVL
jgi:hypothetical protein